MLEIGPEYNRRMDKCNTLDPSPYFGLPLNARTSKGSIIICNGVAYE